MFRDVLLVLGSLIVGSAFGFIIAGILSSGKRVDERTPEPDIPRVPGLPRPPMRKRSTISMWCGRRIGALNRSELIEALEWAATELQAERTEHLRQLDILGGRRGG